MTRILAIEMNSMGNQNTSKPTIDAFRSLVKATFDSLFSSETKAFKKEIAQITVKQVKKTSASTYVNKLFELRNRIETSDLTPRQKKKLSRSFYQHTRPVLNTLSKKLNTEIRVAGQQIHQINEQLQLTLENKKAVPPNENTVSLQQFQGARVLLNTLFEETVKASKARSFTNIIRNGLTHRQFVPTFNQNLNKIDTSIALLASGLQLTNRYEGQMKQMALRNAFKTLQDAAVESLNGMVNRYNESVIPSDAELKQFKKMWDEVYGMPMAVIAQELGEQEKSGVMSALFKQLEDLEKLPLVMPAIRQFYPSIPQGLAGYMAGLQMAEKNKAEHIRQLTECGKAFDTLFPEVEAELNKAKTFKDVVVWRRTRASMLKAYIHAMQPHGLILAQLEPSSNYYSILSKAQSRLLQLEMASLVKGENFQ